MLREELLDAPGMHAEEHQIRLGQGLPGVLADLIHNSLLQGVAKGGLAYVHPHPLKIFKLFQPHSDGAADQPRPMTAICLLINDLLDSKVRLWER